MDTPKALIAGLVVTLGLLAATFGLEGLAQLAGPEEVELHSEEEGSEAEEGEEELELQDDEGDGTEETTEG